MALPKLNDTPKYSMTIPSMGETVKFRPFLVKEEKVLMLAMETEDQQQILNAIIETLSSCIQQEIDVNKLTTFDVEYMFVTLRGKSVGETIDLKMKCKSCQHENEYKLKIDDLKIHMPKISNIIELSEDISIEMSYPTYTMVGSLGGEDVTEADLIFNILANSITKIAIPPSCKVAPLISLKYMGPQSSILYLTIYTKKLAAATIHKYLFLNMLSKNNSLVVSSSSLSPLVNLTSEKSFLYSSIGGRPTD